MITVNHALLVNALKYYGEKEDTRPGKSNPVVLSWLQSILSWVTDDEVSWCAAFVNGVCRESGVHGSGRADARSFLYVGSEVTNPIPGDIVVFWRGSKDSWKGHVGIFIRETSDQIYVLGGNQSNQVNISAYPKFRLLGYRRLKFVYEK